MNINIRQETADDYKQIYELIRESFATAEHSDGTEQDLVNALRDSDNFIPELSLVAEVSGQLVGYILFTKLQVGDIVDVALALAPLAVILEYQRQGVGAALIQYGHQRASELGYGYSFVLGSEDYYSQFGYKRVDQFQIAIRNMKDEKTRKLSSKEEQVHDQQACRGESKSCFDIQIPEGFPPENFMMAKLRDDAPALFGEVIYASEFGI